MTCLLLLLLIRILFIVEEGNQFFSDCLISLIIFVLFDIWSEPVTGKRLCSHMFHLQSSVFCLFCLVFLPGLNGNIASVYFKPDGIEIRILYVQRDIEIVMIVIVLWLETDALAILVFIVDLAPALLNVPAG